MESGGSSWKLNGLLFDPWRQWWILGEANEAVASGPPFLGAHPSILRAPPRKQHIQFWIRSVDDSE